MRVLSVPLSVFYIHLDNYCHNKYWVCKIKGTEDCGFAMYRSGECALSCKNPQNSIHSNGVFTIGKSD